MLAEIGAIEHFDSARQLAAFAGLTPQEHTSGTSPWLCKIGHRRLRKALYFPHVDWVAALSLGAGLWRTTLSGWQD
ncbi:MAG: IS110 family transposase [Leptolyngbya sp. SIOISBB]|nr:IS110 family transposase [Leptolyngbya sp. SIOISBB]